MIRLDGSDRRVEKSANVPRMTAPADLEFADLDNDGSHEIVYMAAAFPHYQSKVVVLSAEDLSVLWESVPDYWGSYVEVANVDNDPALELIVSGGYVVDGMTYVREWSHASALSADNAFDAPAQRNLLARDVDGDGVEEFIGILDFNNRDAGAEAYSFVKQRVIGNAGPLPRPLYDERVPSPLGADIDDDGIVEILGVSYADTSVSVSRTEAT